jgi:hypothetical protein
MIIALIASIIGLITHSILAAGVLILSVILGWSFNFWYEAIRAHISYKVYKELKNKSEVK